MTELLNALKQSNYFLKQYALLLDKNQEDTTAILIQLANNQKLIKGAQPTPEQRKDLLLLSGMEEAPLIVLEDVKTILKSNNIEAKKEDIEAVYKVAKVFNKEQFEAVLMRVESYKAKVEIKNYTGYLIKSLEIEAKELKKGKR